MKHCQSKWEPSNETVKSKSCLDRIFYLQKTESKISSKLLRPVAQKIKLSKNYSNQKSVSCRSLKSLKLKSSRNKKQINIQEIKKRFQEAKTFKNDQNKKMEISKRPYLATNTLQTSVATLKVYDQRQNLQTMFSSRKYSAINSHRQNFHDSELSLRGIKQTNQISSVKADRQINSFCLPQIDKKILSSTRTNTINPQAFVSLNSFYKQDTAINEQQSEQDISISLQKQTMQSLNIIGQQRIIPQKKTLDSQAYEKKKSLVSPQRIKLVSARQVQTIQSIQTQESLIVSQVQKYQNRESKIQNSIFHRILALKKY